MVSNRSCTKAAEGKTLISLRHQLNVFLGSCQGTTLRLVGASKDHVSLLLVVLYTEKG